MSTGDIVWVPVVVDGVSASFTSTVDATGRLKHEWHDLEAWHLGPGASPVTLRRRRRYGGRKGRSAAKRLRVLSDLIGAS